MADPWMQPSKKSKYWENMLKKYEKRNARLQSEECELRHKLEALETSLPIMMCMNIVNQPQMTQLQPQLTQPQPQLTAPQSPSQLTQPQPKSFLSQFQRTEPQSIAVIPQPVDAIVNSSKMPIRDFMSNESKSLRTPYSSCTDCSMTMVGVCECRVPKSKDPRFAQDEQPQTSESASAPSIQPKSAKKYDYNTESDTAPERAPQQTISLPANFQNELCPCEKCALLPLGQCDCGLVSEDDFCPCDDCELMAQGICDCGPQNEEVPGYNYQPQVPISQQMRGVSSLTPFAPVPNSYKSTTKPFKPCDCKFKKLKKTSKTIPMAPKIKKDTLSSPEEVITNPMHQNAQNLYSIPRAQLPHSSAAPTPINKFNPPIPGSSNVRPNLGTYPESYPQRSGYPGQNPLETSGIASSVPPQDPKISQQQHPAHIPKGFSNENCNCRNCQEMATAKCECLAESEFNVPSSTASFQHHNDDLSLLDSEDFLLIERVKRLAEKEKSLKQNIIELNHKENALNETIETFHFLNSNPSIMNKNNTTLNNNIPGEDNQVNLMENLQRLNNSLLQENNRISDELADVKLDTKQMKERLEGPMQRELEREKRKNKNIEDDLARNKEEKNRSEETNKKEIDFIKMQLEAAALQNVDLNTINARLKEELNIMDTKYNDLHQDLVNQKISEANTLSRMKAAQAIAATHGVATPNNFTHAVMQDPAPLSPNPEQVTDILEQQHEKSVPPLLKPNQSPSPNVSRTPNETAQTVPFDKTVTAAPADLPKPNIAEKNIDQTATDIKPDRQTTTEAAQQNSGSQKSPSQQNPIINMMLIQQEPPDLKKISQVNASGEKHFAVNAEFTEKYPITSEEKNRSEVHHDINILDQENIVPIIAPQAVKEVKPIKITTKPTRPRDKVREGSSLNALARDLSDLLHENENNINIPQDMKDTAFEIKVLVDVVDKKFAKPPSSKDKKDDKPTTELYNRNLTNDSNGEERRPEKERDPGSVLTKELEAKRQPIGPSQVDKKTLDVVKRVAEIEPTENTKYEDVEEQPTKNDKNADYDDNAVEDIEIETFVSNLDSAQDADIGKIYKQHDTPPLIAKNIEPKKNIQTADIAPITTEKLTSKDNPVIKKHPRDRTIPIIPTDNPLPNEISIETQLVTDAPVDVNAEVMIVKKKFDGINLTTTLTRSGTLEVITEGPSGIVETVMTLTNSGNIEVVTEITDFDDDVKSDQEDDSNDETTTDTETEHSSKRDDDPNDQPNPGSSEAPGSGRSGNYNPRGGTDEKDKRNNMDKDKPFSEHNPGDNDPSSRFQNAVIHPYKSDKVGFNIGTVKATTQDELDVNVPANIFNRLQTLEGILVKPKVSKKILFNSIGQKSINKIAELISSLDTNNTKERISMSSSLNAIGGIQSWRNRDANFTDKYAADVVSYKIKCPTIDIEIPFENSNTTLSVNESISQITISVSATDAFTDLKSQSELEELILEKTIISEIANAFLHLLNSKYIPKELTVYNPSARMIKLIKSDSNPVVKEIQSLKLFRSSSDKHQPSSEQDFKMQYERRCIKARGDNDPQINDQSKIKRNTSSAACKNYFKDQYMNSIKPQTELQVAVLEKPLYGLKLAEEDIQRLHIQSLFQSSCSIEKLIDKYSFGQYKKKIFYRDSDLTDTYATALFRKHHMVEEDKNSSVQIIENLQHGKNVAINSKRKISIPMETNTKLVIKQLDVDETEARLPSQVQEQLKSVEKLSDVKIQLKNEDEKVADENSIKNFSLTQMASNEAEGRIISDIPEVVGTKPKLIPEDVVPIAPQKKVWQLRSEEVHFPVSSGFLDKVEENTTNVLAMPNNSKSNRQSEMIDQPKLNPKPGKTFATAELVEESNSKLTSNPNEIVTELDKTSATKVHSLVLIKEDANVLELEITPDIIDQTAPKTGIYEDIKEFPCKSKVCEDKSYDGKVLVPEQNLADKLHLTEIPAKIPSIDDTKIEEQKIEENTFENDISCKSCSFIQEEIAKSLTKESIADMTAQEDNKEIDEKIIKPEEQSVSIKSSDCVDCICADCLCIVPGMDKISSASTCEKCNCSVKEVTICWKDETRSDENCTSSKSECSVTHRKSSYQEVNESTCSSSNCLCEEEISSTLADDPQNCSCEYQNNINYQMSNKYSNSENNEQSNSITTQEIKSVSVKDCDNKPIACTCDKCKCGNVANVNNQMDTKERNEIKCIKVEAPLEDVEYQQRDVLNSVTEQHDSEDLRTNINMQKSDKQDSEKYNMESNSTKLKILNNIETMPNSDNFSFFIKSLKNSCLTSLLNYEKDTVDFKQKEELIEANRAITEAIEESDHKVSNIFQNINKRANSNLNMTSSRKRKRSKIPVYKGSFQKSNTGKSTRSVITAGCKNISGKEIISQYTSAASIISEKLKPISEEQTLQYSRSGKSADVLKVDGKLSSSSKPLKDYEIINKSSKIYTKYERVDSTASKYVEPDRDNVDSMFAALEFVPSAWWTEHDNLTEDLQNVHKKLIEALSYYEKNNVQLAEIISNETVVSSKTEVPDIQESKESIDSISNLKHPQVKTENHVSKTTLTRIEDQKLLLEEPQHMQCDFNASPLKINDSAVGTLSVAEENGLTYTATSKNKEYNYNDCSSIVSMLSDEIIAYIPKLNNTCNIRSYNGSVSKIIARKSSDKNSVFEYPIKVSQVKCIYLNSIDINAVNSRKISEGLVETFDDEVLNVKKSDTRTYFNYVDQQGNKQPTNLFKQRCYNELNNKLVFPQDVACSNSSDLYMFNQELIGAMQFKGLFESAENLVTLQNYNESDDCLLKYKPQTHITNIPQMPMLPRINGSNEMVANQIGKIPENDLDESDDDWADALETIPNDNQPFNANDKVLRNHSIKLIDATEQTSHVRDQSENGKLTNLNHGNSCECIDCLTAPFSKAFAVKKTKLEPVLECPICNRIECLGDCEIIHESLFHVQRDSGSEFMGVTESHELYHQRLVSDCKIKVTNGLPQSGDVHLDCKSLPCVMKTICKSSSLESQEIFRSIPSNEVDYQSYCNYSTSVKNLYTPKNKEINNSDEELQELHNIMKQISSACMKAGSRLPASPIYYQNSATNMQTVSNNNPTMEAMIYKLQKNAKNKCNTSAECAKVLAQNQRYNTQVRNFGPEEFTHRQMEQDAYHYSYESGVDKQKRFASRSRRSRNRSKRSNRVSCAQSKMVAAPSNRSSAEAVDAKPLQMTEVKRIGEDSLLVKWQASANENILGYEVCVNEVLKTRVYRKTRTTAVITAIPLDLHPIVNISVYGCTDKGRCLPPALASYHI